VHPLRTRLGLLLAAIGGVVVWALGNPPEDATLAAASWLRKFQLNSWADTLPQSVDTYATVIAVVILLTSLVWALWPARKEAGESKTAIENPQITYNTVSNITHIHYPVGPTLRHTAIIDAYLGDDIQIRNSVNVAAIETLGKSKFNISFATGSFDFIYKVSALSSEVPNFQVTHSSSSSATIYFPSGAPSRLALIFQEQAPQPAASYDMPMYSAIRHVASRIGDSDEKKNFEKSRGLLRQAALDGKIRIWGKRRVPTNSETEVKFSSVYSEIESTYWATSVISPMASIDQSLPDADMWDGHPHTTAESTWSWGPKGIYEQRHCTDLKVNAAEIGKAWP
jgi:hypothetical protein